MIPPHPFPPQGKNLGEERGEKFLSVWVSREVWMDGGIKRHRTTPTPGVSRKPDLPKESSAGPAHLLPPQGARSPTPRAGGFTSPRCPRQGSSVASETRKQGCGSDCCLGREINPGMGRVPGRFRLNSSAEISLEPLPCKPGLRELSSWFGWDGGGEAGGGRWRGRRREVGSWGGALTFGELWEKLPGPAPLQLCLLQPSRLQPHSSTGTGKGLLGGGI